MDVEGDAMPPPVGENKSTLLTVLATPMTQPL